MGKLAPVDVENVDTQHQLQHPDSTYTPPSPSIALLFSYCSRRDALLGVCPAVIVSLAAGGIAPFMTHVIGQAFQAMATFTTADDPHARQQLTHTMGIVALEFVGLALGTLAFSSLMSSIWLWVGERIVMRLRHEVFVAVTTREIEWFDLLGENKDDQDDESIGAGGLMAKFARDTEDVRVAVSLNMGMLIEYTATFFTALILALARSWSLTLVVLSSVPLMMVVQIVSQSVAGPAYNAERKATASAATRIERAVASIPTVKAFNASNIEHAAASKLIDSSVTAYRKCAAVWAGASGMSQVVLFGMFVQGFWYGAYLVHTGKASAGTVMSVFWACVIASSNMQMIMPLLVVLTKGKSGMVSLEEMIHPPPSPPKSYNHPQGRQSQDSILPSYYESVSSAAPTLSTKSPSAPKQTTIRPARCLGTFDIPAGLTFSYASRPDAPPALHVSASTPIHVAGADLTFFVGGSGSGKSTLAQLFMQLYRPDRGSILMDEVPLEQLDRAWVRRHVALVSQECILFDKSVHDNVAIGKLSLAEDGEEITVTREEIEDACRVAMVHDFVKDLPDGYDTMLGTGGASLSGGQRQRVALARAILRDPSVLILDEATSALDATSRVLVFEAIKRHRRRKTTIVITHDLSQITDDDYVYVMKSGRVVEEGFRADLAVVKPTTPAVNSDIDEIVSEDSCRGEFRRMLDKQLKNGGFPTRDDVPDIYENARVEANDLVERALSPEPQNGLLAVPGAEIQRPSTAMSKRQSAIMWAPTVLGSGAATGTTSRATAPNTKDKERAPIPSAFSRHNNVPWQMDAIHDILGPSSSGAEALSQSRSSKMPGSRIRGRYTSRVKSFSADSDEEDLVGGGGGGSFGGDDDDDDETVHNSSGDEEDTKHVNDIPMRSRLHKKNTSTSSLPSPSSDHAEFGAIAIQNAFKTAPTRRRSMTFEPWVYPSTPRKGSLRDDRDSAIAYVVDDDDFEDEKVAMEKSAAQVHSRRQNTLTVVVHDSTTELPTSTEEQRDTVPSLIGVIRQFYSTVPRKPWIALGLLFAVIDGALTPVFSWALAQLMAEMGTGASGYNGTMKWGLMVLFVALGNGVATGAKFYLLEDGAMNWVASLRKASFARILRQDKTWFDDSKHSPERMVQILIKDGDDARTLIATVAGQALVVFTMISLGIGWALVIGWQLTLVGLAIGPVFALAMMGQSVLTSRFELRNKRAREDVARRYYEVIANIRAIRSMALENEFSKHFEDSLEEARSTGVHGAFAAGMGYGVSQALIYLTEALLFWVGAKFIANGTYTYLRLVEVLDLLIFSVSIGGQLMTFVPLVAKSKQAAADFGKLLTLDLYNTESRGLMRFPVKGDVTLEDVHFTYANRPDAPVLRGINGVIKQGECVAIVGASGCGKSTIGSLLQRLYEPSSGRVTVGGFNIADADVAWLRDHVAVVSQHPMLFDTSIADNITYGSEPGRFNQEDIKRAAQAAHLDEFIQTLPNGYETTIGEKAALLSGGQAQRLQIARALVNGQAQIMVFDECTSALDPANQAAVMETIMSVKQGRTTLLITHKVPVMQMCDRILVVDGGRIVEEGTFDELIQKRGTFHQLASAGEWASLD